MKNTNLKRAVAATLAVVTISLTFFSYFRLTAQAGNSLKHIEEIKAYQKYSGAGFKIVEIAPDANQGSFGYYVKGSEPPIISQYSNVLKNIDNPSGRQTFMNSIEAKLGSSGHGLIGGSYSPEHGVDAHHPIVRAGAYGEQYPWASTNAGKPDFPESELGAGTINQLNLNHTEDFTAKGYMTEVGEGQGDYTASLTYRLPWFNPNIYDFVDFEDKCTIVEGNNGYGHSIGADPDQEYVKTNCDTGYTVINEEEDGFIFKSGPGCIHQTDIYFANFSDALALDVTPGRTYYFNYRVKVIDEGVAGLGGPRSAMRVVGANASLSGYASYFYDKKLENVDGEGNVYYTSHTLELHDEYYIHKPTVPVGRYEDISVCITAGPDMEYMYFNYGFKGNGTIEIRSLTIGESSEPVDSVQNIQYFKKGIPEVKGNNLIDFGAYVDNPISGILVGGSTGDSVTFDRVDKTATIVTDNIGSGGGSSFDIYTRHDNQNAYFMNAKPNTTYEFSFDIQVDSGAAQVHVFQIKQDFGSCSNWANVNSRWITPQKAELLGNRIVLRFVTDSDCRYINFRIGTDAASTNAVYSNFALNEIIFPQAYYYAVTPSLFSLPIRYDGESAEDFAARLKAFKYANNGKAIYKTNNSGAYEYIDTYSLDNVQGIAGGFQQGVEYYTLSIKKGTYPAADLDDEHPYCAMYGDIPSPYFHKYSALDEAGPFFVEEVDYYTYVGKTEEKDEDGNITYKHNGNYSFTFDDGHIVEIKSNVIFYNGGYVNTNMFERFVFDCGQNEGFPYSLKEGESVNASVTTLTPGSLNSPQNLRVLEDADLIVFSKGLRVEDELKFADGDDLSDDDTVQSFIRNYINVDKMPVVVDTDLLTSSSTPVRLKTFLFEICDNITTGGITKSVYRFSKSDGNVDNLANTNILHEIAGLSQEGPYSSVGTEIQNENGIRQDLPNPHINQASCIRYAINYKNQKLYFTPDVIKVLDIEPYTSNPSLTVEMVRTWLPKGNEYQDIEIQIDGMAVAEFNCKNDDWMHTYDVVYIGTSNENMNVVPFWRCTEPIKDEDGKNTGKCGCVNGIDNETCQISGCSGTRLQAFKDAYSKDKIGYNQIDTSMDYDPNKTYDDVDFRYSPEEKYYYDNYTSYVASFENPPEIRPGYPIYNDATMNGLYYTNTGDTLYTSNKKAIERPELGGLLREDYMGYGSVVDSNFIGLGGKAMVRSSGNDISATTVKKLEGFIESGRLCVLSSDLSTGTSVTSILPLVEIEPRKSAPNEKVYKVAFGIKFADDPDTPDINEAQEMEKYSFKENLSKQTWQFRPQGWIDKNQALLQREKDGTLQDGDAEELAKSWITLPKSWNTITPQELIEDTNNYRYFRVAINMDKVTSTGIKPGRVYVCNTCQYHETSTSYNENTFKLVDHFCPVCGENRTFTADPYRPDSFYNYTIDSKFLEWENDSDFQNTWAAKYDATIKHTALGEYRCLITFEHQGVKDNLVTNGCALNTKELDLIFRFESGNCTFNDAGGSTLDEKITRTYSKENYYMSFWEYMGGDTWQNASYSRVNLPDEIDLQCLWYYFSTKWNVSSTFSRPVGDVSNIPTRAYTTTYGGHTRCCALMNVSLHGSLTPEDYQHAVDVGDSTDYSDFGTFKFMKKYGVPQSHAYADYDGCSTFGRVRIRTRNVNLIDGFNDQYADTHFMYYLHKGSNSYLDLDTKRTVDINSGSKYWLYLYGDLSVPPTATQERSIRFNILYHTRTNITNDVSLYWRITLLDLDSVSPPKINVTPVPSWLKMNKVDNTSQMWNFISNNFNKRTASPTETGAVVVDTFCDENDAYNNRDTNLIGCLQYSKPKIHFVQDPIQYPQELLSNSISFDFVIVDKNHDFWEDEEKRSSYEAYLYIDSNNDGKFDECVDKNHDGIIDKNHDFIGERLDVVHTGLKVSEKENSHLNDPTLRNRITWDLAPDEKGLIPWKLVIKETTNHSNGQGAYIFETGYSYIKPGVTDDPITIKALMILPGNWWSNEKDGWYPENYNPENDRYMPNPGYNPSETQENEKKGNAYIGNAFLGEAFHNLPGLEYTVDEDCKVIYEGDKKKYTGYDGSDGLRHIGFNYGYGDKENRFTEIAIDIACIPIYDMNKNWFPVPKNIKDDTENWFESDNNSNPLFSYNLLILGFGDSWAKSKYGESSWGVVGFTGGLNKRSANAILAYIESGGATLFCHDSTNKENIFVTYKLNEIAGDIIDAFHSVARWVNSTIITPVLRLWGVEEDKIEDYFIPTPDSSLADSKTKQGWWGNYMLRNVMGLDRYGITYAIRTRAKAISIGQDQNPNNNNGTSPPYPRYSEFVVARAHQYNTIYDYYRSVSGATVADPPVGEYPLADKLRLENMQREILDDPSTQEYKQTKIPYTIAWLPNRAKVFKTGSAETNQLTLEKAFQQAGGNRIYNSKGFFIDKDRKDSTGKYEIWYTDDNGNDVRNNSYGYFTEGVENLFGVGIYEGMPIYGPHGTVQGDGENRVYEREDEDKQWSPSDDPRVDNGVTVPGNQYDRYTQGFTGPTITRYSSARKRDYVALLARREEDYRNQLLPTRHLNNIFRTRFETIKDSSDNNHIQNVMTQPIYANNITQVNEGQINTYPYDIRFEDKNELIPVKTTHEQVYQCNTNGDDITVWYCLAGSSPVNSNETYFTVNNDGTTNGIRNDCINSYYLYSRGNVMYTGAGHANVFNEFEAKLFINTLVASYRNAAVAPHARFMDNVEDKNKDGVVIKFTDKGIKSYLFIEEMKDDNGLEYLQAMSNVYFSMRDNNYDYSDKDLYADLCYIDSSGNKVNIENDITLTRYSTVDASENATEKTVRITGTSVHSNKANITYEDGTSAIAFNNMDAEIIYGFELPEEIISLFEGNEELTSVTICLRPTTIINKGKATEQTKEGAEVRMEVRRVLLSDLA